MEVGVHRDQAVRLRRDGPLQRTRQRVPRRGSVRSRGPEREVAEDPYHPVKAVPGPRLRKASSKGLTPALLSGQPVPAAGGRSKRVLLSRGPALRGDGDGRGPCARLRTTGRFPRRETRGPDRELPGHPARGRVEYSIILWASLLTPC